MDENLKANEGEKTGKIKLEVSDPRRFFCDRAFILFNDEHFVLALQTGSVVESQYAFTPKHMKRLFLRLKERIEEYELKHGELKTSLPAPEDAE